MVNTSLYSGLSGLRAHQAYIDVIGSNLANVSTVGYRGSRVTFADLLSVTQSAGSRPNGDFGGTNPRQVGLGTSIGSIDVNTRQGTFSETGRGLDVALEGRGFFTLTDGSQTYYSRVGTFGVDEAGQLVDLRNGFRVLGSNGTPINVPVTGTLPAQATTEIDFAGSLPATVNGPLQEVVRSDSPMLEGQAASQSATFSGGTVDLSSFSNPQIQVSVNGTSPVRVDLPNGAAVTPQEVRDAFASAFGASFDSLLDIQFDNAAGTIQIDSIRLGDQASLRFEDATGSVGLLSALGWNSTQVNGSESIATDATDLAAFTSRIAPYATNDGIRVTGTGPDGTPFSSTFVYGVDGTTLGELRSFVNGLVPNSSAQLTLDGSGHLLLTANDPGEANISLFLGDSGSPAKNSWSTFAVDQEGTGPDTAVASIDVFDSLGRAHSVQFEFTRTAADSQVWDMVATLPDGEGSVVSGSISSIRFGQDGSFNTIGGGTNSLVFRFDGVTSDQSITIDLGASSGFDGLTQIGDTSSVAAVDQDGFTAGTLLDVGFDAAGNLNGVYSNGQAQSIDQLRIAMFQNEGGLIRQADTLFITGPNSDDAIEVSAGSAGAGFIRSGALENSNVDIAEEFVSLIEAQRGFQANSRIITTTDEILAELVNIVN